jgi:hypothetical protein
MVLTKACTIHALSLLQLEEKKISQLLQVATWQDRA